MNDITFLLLLSIGSATAFFLSSFLPRRPFKAYLSSSPSHVSPQQNSATQKIHDIKHLADSHDAAAVLADLIHKDGAGAWPPLANHAHGSWPLPLRPYKEVFLEMSPYLASTQASLDDSANRLRIDDFRAKFRALLDERVDLAQVRLLLEAAEAGRWDVFPRDVYNAFYCCVAMCRHAYRWSAIPVVRVAQLETFVDLPVQLIEPWTYLQRHFGCTSESGNNMSNLVLNFDPNGTYIHKINVGLSETITSSEEAFGRIFYDVECFALPIYHDMVRAIIAFARGDKPSCATHVSRITNQLRPLLSSYYDRVHDSTIARSAWLSHVQGFYAWGAGYPDADAPGGWVKFDGLSGNQVLLFQALDAFCGLGRYLDEETRERNVPARQRELVRVLEKHSFRARLDTSEDDVKIATEFEEIIKRLRVFRSAHRSRAKTYLSQPAPERLPMTAGKSLLKSDLEQSLDYLDEFMVKRLSETV